MPLKWPHLSLRSASCTGVRPRRLVRVPFAVPLELDLPLFCRSNRKRLSKLDVARPSDRARHTLTCGAILSPSKSPLVSSADKMSSLNSKSVGLPQWHSQATHTNSSLKPAASTLLPPEKGRRDRRERRPHCHSLTSHRPHRTAGRGPVRPVNAPKQALLPTEPRHSPSTMRSHCLSSSHSMGQEQKWFVEPRKIWDTRLGKVSKFPSHC